ncbi:unnamed protein product [Prorocentrum cordatum]|uniref:Pirin N-terminal domain-containing protein n=1 Tax=Prorocentrum cordatum TaxID=2364126 RepID=A0ABN9WLK0_9DINO|nr:unnamed protein product [Polarella glacialis]
MPEGFPAHPHRGFETVTYVLRGGLVHRDSFGIKKSYGAPPDSDGSGDHAAVQWMTAGRGLRHEEMWRTGGAWDSTDQELFQIWVNLPASAKMVPPRMQMLREPSEQEQKDAEGEAPGVGGGVRVDELGPVPKAQPGPGVTVRVVAGEACGVRSPVETHSELAILHVTLEPGASWSWPRPQGWTCLAYMRRGEGAVNGGDVPVHHTATVSRANGGLALEAGPEGADLLLLSGRPLGERVEMGGNVVMNSGRQLEEAQRDLALGTFGPQWAHEEDDASWRGIVAAHWGRFERLLERARSARAGAAGGGGPGP